MLPPILQVSETPHCLSSLAAKKARTEEGPIRYERAPSVGVESVSVTHPRTGQRLFVPLRAQAPAALTRGGSGHLLSTPIAFLVNQAQSALTDAQLARMQAED